MIQMFKTGGWLGVALLVAVPLLMSSAFAADADKGRQISVLVYNTHGLPGLIAFDKPKQRFPKIAALSGQYDLVLLQEDFAHHDVLLENLTAPTSVTRGARPDIPPCVVGSGSGLTQISNLPEADWTMATRFEPFGVCAGWLFGASDCFAQKGFQISVLGNADGDRVVIVNTHLDAGRSEFDRWARGVQLDHIATVLEQEATNDAIIMAGDFNLDWNSPEDRALLLAFRQRLGLGQVETGITADRGWEILDYVLYRSGQTADLTVLHAGEDRAFENDDGALSDHPALSVIFQIGD